MSKDLSAYYIHALVTSSPHYSHSGAPEVAEAHDADVVGGGVERGSGGQRALAEDGAAGGDRPDCDEVSANKRAMTL